MLDGTPIRARALASLVSVVVVAALSSCAEVGTGPTPTPSEITELPRQLSVSEREVIRASNRFAFELAAEVTAPDSSFFLSPLSGSMALGMTMNGAAGETYEQMRAALGFGELPQDEINASYASLIELLLDLDPRVEVALGNSIWFDSTRMAVRDSFIDTVQEPFDAEVAGLDFSGPGAPETINAWVSESTNGRIDEIVPTPIPPLVAMYLINAIYFKGDWTTQFDPDRTAQADFRRSDGSTVRVPMMERDADSLAYYRDGEVEAVDLPYGGRAFSMTVLLPRGGGAADIESLVASLDAERWRDITDGFVQGEVHLFLPRFELTWERVLNDDLKALGMTDAFDEQRADFSKLTPDPGVIIHEVKQKSFVSVDEEGTEAAAATSVGVGPTSAPPTFRADRPFVFAIRERLSGTILFLGKVVDPTE